MIRRIAAIFLALALVAGLSGAALALSPLDWYTQAAGGEDGEAVPEPQSPEEGTGTANAVVFREEKLFSTLFGGLAVGKTVVPEGWRVETQDLTLGSESISWPNALYVTVTSPDGACVMKYMSRRLFTQWYTNLMGFTAQSTDDAYDYSEMMHTLDYRDAAGVGDLMVDLLFDDSFSALDFSTDKALRKALKENIQDCTFIIVAQRINTILDAEQIIVLDNGRMVGKGTHEELLKTCKVYREIALSQLSEEELAKAGSHGETDASGKEVD